MELYEIHNKNFVNYYREKLTQMIFENFITTDHLGNVLTKIDRTKILCIKLCGDSVIFPCLVNEYFIKRTCYVGETSNICDMPIVVYVLEVNFLGLLRDVVKYTPTHYVHDSEGYVIGPSIDDIITQLKTVCKLK